MRGLTAWLAQWLVPKSHRDSWTVVEVMSYDPPVYVSLFADVTLEDAQYYAQRINDEEPEMVNYPRVIDIKRSTEVAAAGGIAKRRQAFTDWKRES